MRNTFIALVSLLFLIGCSEKKSDKNLQITGNIKGLKKGTLYIQELKDSTLVILDSIVFNGSSAFESDIDIKSPEMLYLFLDRGVTNSVDNNLKFFAEPGKINIETSLEFFYAKAKVTGSKNNDLYEEYKKVNSRYTNQQLELTVENLKDKAKLSDEAFQQQTDAILKRKYLYAINFAINNKNSEVAPYIALAEISNANIKYLDTIQKSLTPKVADSKYGKMLSKFIAERKKLDQ